jgi:hypothetical protein
MKCERCHTRRKAAHQWFDQDGNELYICNKCWAEVPHNPPPSQKEQEDDEADPLPPLPEDEKPDADDDFLKSSLDESPSSASKWLDDPEDFSKVKTSLNMDVRLFLRNISKKRNGKKTLAAHYAAIAMAKRNKLGKCRGIGVSMGNDRGKELHGALLFDPETNSIFWKAYMGTTNKRESWWEMHLSLMPDGSDLDGTILYYSLEGGLQSWTITDVPLDFYEMVDMISKFLVKHGESLDDM